MIHDYGNKLIDHLRAVSSSSPDGRPPFIRRWGASEEHWICIRPALEAHSNALSLSQGRKELGAGKRATTDCAPQRPPLTLLFSPPSLSQPACPLSSRPSGEGRGQTSRLNYVLGEDDLGRIFKAICSSLQIVTQF